MGRLDNESKFNFSGEAYDVEDGELKHNELSIDSNYLILDTVDTNIDTIGNESEPKKNSMQAMIVGEIRENIEGSRLNN